MYPKVGHPLSINLAVMREGDGEAPCMALPEKQNPPMATHEATTFLKNGASVGQHLPRVPTHPAGDHDHRPVQHGTFRGSFLTALVGVVATAAILEDLKAIHTAVKDQGGVFAKHTQSIKTQHPR